MKGVWKSRRTSGGGAYGGKKTVDMKTDSAGGREDPEETATTLPKQGINFSAVDKRRAELGWKEGRKGDKNLCRRKRDYRKRL